jgi:hypothetical protein
MRGLENEAGWSVVQPRGHRLLTQQLGTHDLHLAIKVKAHKVEGHFGGLVYVSLLGAVRVGAGAELDGVEPVEPVW